MATLSWILSQADQYTAGHIHLETDGQVRLRLAEGLRELCELTPDERQQVVADLAGEPPAGWTATELDTLHGLRVVLERARPWPQAAEIARTLQAVLLAPTGLLAVATPPHHDLAGLLATCALALPSGWTVEGRTCKDLAIAVALLRARGLEPNAGMFVEPVPEGLQVVAEVYAS